MAMKNENYKPSDFFVSRTSDINKTYNETENVTKQTQTTRDIYSLDTFGKEDVQIVLENSTTQFFDGKTEPNNLQDLTTSKNTRIVINIGKNEFVTTREKEVSMQLIKAVIAISVTAKMLMKSKGDMTPRLEAKVKELVDILKENRYDNDQVIDFAFGSNLMNQSLADAKKFAQAKKKEAETGTKKKPNFLSRMFGKEKIKHNLFDM